MVQEDRLNRKEYIPLFFFFLAGRPLLFFLTRPELSERTDELWTLEFSCSESSSSTSSLYIKHKTWPNICYSCHIHTEFLSCISTFVITEQNCTLKDTYKQKHTHECQTESLIHRTKYEHPDSFLTELLFLRLFPRAPSLIRRGAIFLSLGFFLSETRGLLLRFL